MLFLFGGRIGPLESLCVWRQGRHSDLCHLGHGGYPFCFAQQAAAAFCVWLLWVPLGPDSWQTLVSGRAASKLVGYGIDYRGKLFESTPVSVLPGSLVTPRRDKGKAMAAMGHEKRGGLAIR